MPMPTPEELEAERLHEEQRKAAFQSHWRTRPDDVCPKVLMYRAEDDRQCQVSKGEEAAWEKVGFAVESEKDRSARADEKAKAAAERSAKAAADRIAKAAKPAKP